jgi:hypothetical protein
MHGRAIGLPYGVAGSSLLLAAQLTLTACASAVPPAQVERLRLQDEEVIAAGVAFVTRIIPRARRYEVTGKGVDSRVLAFAASRSKLVPVAGGIEAPIVTEARDVTVQVEVGSLAWLHAEARLPITYRVGPTASVRCDVWIVHSDNSPSWGIAKSAEPSCMPSSAGE